LTASILLFSAVPDGVSSVRTALPFFLMRDAFVALSMEELALVVTFFGSIASVGFRGINGGRQNVGSADTWSGGPKHSEDDRA
jgi:hypothetical protein